MNRRGVSRSLACRVGVAVLAILLCRPGQTRAAEGQDSQKPADQFQNLLQQYQSAQQEFFRAYQAAKTDEERQKIAPRYPQANSYAPRFLALARQYPTDPAALDALVWVVSVARFGPDAQDALALLQRDYLRSDKLAPVCQSLANSPLSHGEEFLRAVAAKNPHHDIQGQALYALALTEKDRSPTEAEKLFEQVAATFGDGASFRGTLADAAHSELYEMRALGAGKPAPEIEGQDLEGKRFRLSDYRGKVVMLDFWGDW